MHCAALEGWNIPTRDQLVKLTTPQMQNQSPTNPLETLGSNTGNPVFQQTTTPQKAYPENYTERTAHDPLMRKWEVFDYWTADRHAVILAKEFVLLNETHNFGRVPFLGFCFRNAPDSAHGYGIAYWLTDFQRVCQGVINAFLDDMNLNLMGTYTSPAGANNSAQAQWIFPGKVFKSDPQGPIDPSYPQFCQRARTAGSDCADESVGVKYYRCGSEHFGLQPRWLRAMFALLAR